MSKLTLDQLNAMSEADFTAALGDIYEHSPWVAKAAYERRPFGKLSTLHNAMAEAVRDATANDRMVLIKAHPDLAGKAARAGALTADFDQRAIERRARRTKRGGIHPLP